MYNECKNAHINFNKKRSMIEVAFYPISDYFSHNNSSFFDNIFKEIIAELLSDHICLYYVDLSKNNSDFAVDSLKTQLENSNEFNGEFTLLNESKTLCVIQESFDYELFIKLNKQFAIDWSENLEIIPYCEQKDITTSEKIKLYRTQENKILMQSESPYPQINFIYACDNKKYLYDEKIISAIKKVCDKNNIQVEI